MTLWPRSLFARTALLVTALIVTSQLGWVVITHALVEGYSRRDHLHPIADLAVVVDHELDRRAASGRPGSPAGLVTGTGVILRRRPPGHRLRPFPPTSPLLRTLERRLGPGTRLLTDPREHRLWIALPVRGSPHPDWLVVPESPFWRALPYTTLLGLAFGIAVALAGALFVSARLRRHLRHVTRAADTIGRGATPPPLPLRGPLELRHLNAGINRMVDDLRTRAEDHRQILAGISHDLRTPLTRLRLALELSEPRLEPALAEGMVQDLEDMDRIVARFLDYARHGREEEPAPLDLVPLVGEVVDRYRRGGTAIGWTAPASAPVTGRPLALSRLVTNLVDNAVRHGGDGVAARLEPDGDGWILHVEDRGPGLDPAWARERLEGERTEHEHDGAARAGLGLATAGRIARLHGASVRVERRPEGGTRVSVRFTAASRPGNTTL